MGHQPIGNRYFIFNIFLKKKKQNIINLCHDFKIKKVKINKIVLVAKKKIFLTRHQNTKP